MRPIEKTAHELGLQYTLDPIKPGDLYLAERFNGPKILTCKEVNNEERYIVSTDRAEFYFSFFDCVKLKRNTK